MLALLCAAVSGADPVRLDPKWEKGDRTDVHLVVLLDARVETPIVDYREQRVRDCRYRQTAIEVDGGRPSRVERNFTSYEVKETKRSGEDRPKASTRKRTRSTGGRSSSNARRAFSCRSRTLPRRIRKAPWQRVRIGHGCCRTRR